MLAAGIVLGSVGGAIGQGVARNVEAREVSTQHLRIVDAAGRARIELSGDEDNPAIVMRNRAMTPVLLFMGTRSGGVVVNVLAADGRAKITLEIDDNGEVGMTARSRSGREKVLLP
jgi:hypothetical protein